jgi:hypothetical protein
MDTANLIEQAVAPLKADAMNRAEEQATQLIERVRAELEAAGNDAQLAAPFPKSFNMDRASYMQAKAKYELFRRLTLSADGAASRRHGAPEPRVMSPPAAAALIAEFRESAAASYEAYVAKLVAKIGPVQAATLAGAALWGYSELTVTTEAGELQKWRTQMILNVSVLGKLFNQWPTRRVKG